MRLVLTVLFLAAGAALTGFSVAVLPIYDDRTGTLLPLVPITYALWAIYAITLAAFWRVPARAVTALVLGGGILIGGAALLGPPNTSTDSARYAWDGIVQTQGVSPYAYVPRDPALAEIRPDWLFPAAVDGECVGPRIAQTTDLGTDDVLCTPINRPWVPTIYPPTSEIVFLLERLVVGPDATYWPMQVTGLLMSLGVTVMLLVALRRRGLDPRWAAIWAWSPLVATEAVTNSHIDVLAGLLVLAATLLVSTGRPWRGGIALGAAIGAKLIPVIAAPALVRRHGWKVAVGAIATFVLLYVPYVATTGLGVLGYLPGYLGEEGYETGSRFIMLAFLPGVSATVAAAALLAATAVLVWRNSDPLDPWVAQTVMLGVVLIVVTPRYPWYALLLAPIVAMTGRWEWMAVPLALTQRLLIPSPDLARIAMVCAIVLIVVMSIRRAGTGWWPRLRRWARDPLRVRRVSPARTGA